MFHLLASIASPFQNDFDYRKASIAKALVLVLHRFSSQGFVVLRTSIFGFIDLKNLGGFDSSSYLFLPILLLVRVNCFLIERIVVFSMAVVLVIMMTRFTVYRGLRLL